ncbi:MAG: C39 family peptidase [Zavarzinella sp.]
MNGQKKQFNLNVEQLETREVPAFLANLDISTGVLTMNGTAGNDTAQIVQQNGVLFLNGASQTSISKGSTILGYTGTVISSQMVNRIEVYGKAGDDVISLNNVPGSTANKNIALHAWGGKGNDTITGSTGDDFLYGDDRAVAITETMYASNEFTLVEPYNWLERATLLPDGNDIIIGGGGNDYLSGQGGSDQLRGESGNDTLDGGNGNDTLRGGTGDDRLFGEGDNDFLYGDSGNDQLYGGSGVDRLYAGDDHDKLYGGDQNDYLYGEGGNDELSGGSGDDLLNGGLGKDRLSGDAGDDQMYFFVDGIWGAHFDTMRSGKNRSDDIFDGGTGNDRLWLTSGNDALVFEDFSYANNDVPWHRLNRIEQIFALSGDDYINLSSLAVASYNMGVAEIVIDGGFGNDYLKGNAGLTNHLNGNYGDDTLVAITRTDTIDGFYGTDTATVFAGQPGIGIEKLTITVPGGSPQNDSWSCGPNSIARLLRAYGINATYEEVRSFTRYDGNLISWLKLGTPTSQMLDTMRHWKPDSRIETESNTNRIVDLIQQGKPVILLVSMGKIGIPFGNVGAMHYVVVNGYDATTDTFTITDTDGVRKFLTRSELDYRWKWVDDFTGSGEIAQGAFSALGFSKRTLFY